MKTSRGALISKVLKGRKKKLAESCSIDAGVYGQQVEKKAYELYEKRGRADGYDCDDWFEAQKIVENEMIARE